jgi:hypothetical protein
MNTIFHKLCHVEDRLYGILPDIFVRRSIITVFGLELFSAILLCVLWVLEINPANPATNPLTNAIEFLFAVWFAPIQLILLFSYIPLVAIIPVYGIVNFVRKGFYSIDKKSMQPSLKSALVGSVLLGLNWPLFFRLFLLIDRYSILGAD